MPRVLNVVRLQFLNRQTYLGIPLIILGGTLLLSVLIFQLIPGTGPKYAGGAAGAPLWYFSAMGSLSLTLTFPFALALSVTRREFHLGTLMTAALASLMLAAIYCTIAILEKATGGWGVNGYVSLPGLGGDELVVAFLAYFTVSMLFFAVGYLGAAVFKRWGGVALFAAITAVVLLLAGAVLLVVRLGAGPSVASWIAGQGFAGLSAWVLLLVALMWAGSYLVVRRLTP